MRIQTLVVTPFMQNARIISDVEAQEAMVVDPGGDIPAILDAIQFSVTKIVLTHSHIDHAGGVAELLVALEKKQGKRPKLFAHPFEKTMRVSLGQQAVMFGLSPKEYQNCPEPDEFVDDGDVIVIGAQSWQVLFTPGHSPGHISLYHPMKAGIVKTPVLVAGDALFAGAIGRTDLPGGDHMLLIRSIREKLFVLPGETVVLPGHGPETTIAEEQQSNPFMQ